MKYIKKFESNDFVAFERTFKISQEKKILNIIKSLKLKNIEFTTYHIKKPQGFDEEFIKIYGISNKNRTLRKLGFNLFSTTYNFTWDWKPIKDIELFLSSNKYNI